MTIKRLVFLIVFLAAGLASALVLPRRTEWQPLGVRLELPKFVGKWYGRDEPVTERELQTLAGDTQFARKLYTDPVGHAIFVSIVLSGEDLDNSIHRPERCLPAQGYTITGSSRVAVPLGNGRILETTRLHDVREVPLQNGQPIPVYNLNYYWFIGYHHVTASHLERTYLDIKDRVVHGYNQRWAYIMVTADITEGLTPYGLSEKETAAALQQFIAELYPSISKPR